LTYNQADCAIQTKRHIVTPINPTLVEVGELHATQSQLLRIYLFRWQ